MRFNDRELACVSRGNAVVEGRLNHKKTGGNRTQPGFKERWFKLRQNFLFYYNLSDTGNVIDEKPSGVIILENCFATLEEMAETPFMFSITFNDEFDKKHIFSGRSYDSVEKWITSLNVASYEYLRTNLKSLQNQLKFLTGQDPLLMFYQNERSQVPLQSDSNAEKEQVKLRKRPTFRSYVHQDVPTPRPSKPDLSFIDDYFGNSLSAIGSALPSDRKEENSTQSPVLAIERPRPLRKAPDPPARPPRGQKLPMTNNNLIDL